MKKNNLCFEFVGQYAVQIDPLFERGPIRVACVFGSRESAPSHSVYELICLRLRFLNVPPKNVTELSHRFRSPSDAKRVFSTPCRSELTLQNRMPPSSAPKRANTAASRWSSTAKRTGITFSCLPIRLNCSPQNTTHCAATTQMRTPRKRRGTDLNLVTSM